MMLMNLGFFDGEGLIVGASQWGVGLPLIGRGAVHLLGVSGLVADYIAHEAPQDKKKSTS
jgi:hypothetical protein